MASREHNYEVSHYSKSNVRSRLIDSLKGCILCCYLLCPPVPDAITRKLAFHPPLKGSYSIKLLDNGSDTTVSRASQLVGKTFRIYPKQRSRTSPSDYDAITRRVECFVLRTSRKNYIIAIKCSPSDVPLEETLKELVVLFSQPNASDLGEYLQPLHMNVPMLADLLGTDVYAYDYSGYGMSTGKPSEKNIYADIRAVYSHVRQTQPNKKIVLLGYSLGTAVASDLAASAPDGLTGVVLVAPFTSGLRLFREQPTLEKSSRIDRFTTIDKVKHIKVPLLVCHGCRDEAIPYEHGTEIEKKALRPVQAFLLPEADHMSIFNGKYLQPFQRIRFFLSDETELGLQRKSRSKSSQQKTGSAPSGQTK